MRTRAGMRVFLQLLLAIASLCLLLAIYFFWLLVPVAGILLYALVQYGFLRRGRRVRTLRELRLEQEAQARALDIRRSGR
jgi:Flp pilus assembly protein TadB